MLRWFILAGTHLAMLAAGFALGVYMLPILTAPKGPDQAALAATKAGAMFTATFDRNRKGSDFLHWGEGEIRISPSQIAHEGRLAPGPDYKLYLVDTFVENEEEFLKVKSTARRIADIKTFNGFIAEVPDGVDVKAYTTVVVWCEAFSEFITSAKYR